MKLIIDIGNTFAKVALCRSPRDMQIFKSKELDIDTLSSIEDKGHNIDGAILCSVRQRSEELIGYLVDSYGSSFVEVTHETPMPLTIKYQTPATLGMDRVMAAIGGRYFCSEKNLLVCDFGSAITFDVVSSAGEFIGGNISAGAALRFKVLHEYTDRLPLCELEDNVGFVGENTSAAVTAGVVNGIVYEAEGYIERLEKLGTPLCVFFTGGDAKYFADKLKKPIFVESYLTIIGMYEVLKFCDGKMQ